MTKLSVNINKVATIRNARGGNLPDVVRFASDCERFGAQGITVHPRPDQRHIRYSDVRQLKPVITTEFNIEGNPVPSFVELVSEVLPTQVTLVPDTDNVLTSNAGWDTVKHFHFLKDIVAQFHSLGIRVSIFIDPVPALIENAKLTGTDRVELYTEAYAARYAANREAAIATYVEAANVAHSLDLGLNAGHDLNLHNLSYFKQRIPFLDEVSIGHALISDALYLGIEDTIHQYLSCLDEKPRY